MPGISILSVSAEAEPDRIRVLVVEPAAGRRRVIRTTLAGNDGFVVVGMATTLAEGRALLDSSRPDVLVADASLPRLDELAQIALACGGVPMVVVHSDWRRDGASDDGPRSGACAAQPWTGVRAATMASLIAALRTSARPPPPPPKPPPPKPGPGPAPLAAPAAHTVPGHQATPGAAASGQGFRWNGRIILIGASTGGVDAIEQVLADFPADCPPTLIVQHMPEAFLVRFAQRLHNAVRPAVRLAQDGDRLVQGAVLIAPGGPCHTVIEGSAPARCRLLAGRHHHGHRPSVDIAFDSAFPIAGQVVATLLTGMGRDGAASMRRLRDAGSRTLAQDRDSAVIWGMPGAAWAEGGVEVLVPLARMAERLLGLCSHLTSASAGMAPYG